MRIRRFAVLLVLVLGWPLPALRAQESLARAKDFYAAAAYEDALKVLGALQAKSPAAEVAAYQVYCLLALGRSDEAKAAIEGLVQLDPLYQPTDADASPRVRAFFEQVRRPLLPEIVRDAYARGKDAFYRKDMTTATEAFDRVVKILDSVDVSENEELADLRTLAGGFRELSRVAPPPPPPVATAPAPTTASVTGPRPGAPASSAAPPGTNRPGPPTVKTPSVYGPQDEGVVRPVPLARTVPRWRPINATEERLELQGAIELVVGEAGTVLSVTITRSIHPRYDPLILRAAREWTFRPAMKDGVAVKYRYPFDVRLGGQAQ
jgi:TonB family protein